MRIHPIVLLVPVLVFPAVATAQHGAAPPGASTTAPRETSQYDFLLGEWELTIRMPPPSLAARIHGMPALIGTWKAWRALDGWGVEDELRITDKAGNPRAFNKSTRVYDPTAKRWSVTTLDVYRARFNSVSAEWKGTEMLLSSKGTDPDGQPYQSRTRIYDITPTSFKFQQDRSTDDGKSWTEGTLRMEAKRIAAAGAR